MSQLTRQPATPGGQPATAAPSPSLPQGGLPAPLPGGPPTGPDPGVVPVVPRGTRRSALVAVLQHWLEGTPGQLRVAAVLVIIGALAAGGGAAQALHTRAAALADARTDAARLLLIQQVRTSLAEADADAVSATLSSYVLVNGQPQLEPPGLRADYVAAIDTATHDLGLAADGVSGADAGLLGAITAGMVRYAGTIESGRTFTRLNNPTGAVFIKSAAGQLRADVLPALTTLADHEQVQVSKDFDRATNARLWLILVGLGGLLLLIGVQVWLAGRFHRVLNAPLVGATAGLAVLLLISGGGMWYAGNRAADVRFGAYLETTQLAQARVSGFDARSQEGLVLLSQGSGQVYEDAFNNSRTQTLAVLPADQHAVSDAFTGYTAQHAGIVKAAAEGDWPKAFALATTGSSATAFAAFARVSATALDRTQPSVGTKLDSSRLGLDPLAGLMVLAGLVGAGLAWSGVSRRLDEYR